MTGDDRIRDLLEKAGPLPEGLPPPPRARLDQLALSGPRRASPWIPAGIGIAAGVLIALGARPCPPAPAFPAGAVSAPASAWRSLNLPDGSAVDLAPGSRMTLVAPRPGVVARLEEGTAWFAVPSGKGRMGVEVPGGRVEVVGTQFGISVETNPKGDVSMRNPWMIGGAAAIVAVGVTSGVVHYVGGKDARSVPVKAGERLEVDRAGAARVTAVREREEALQKQEKALAEREKGIEEKARLLAEREKATGTQPVATPVPGAPDEAMPVAAAKPKKNGLAKMMEMTAKMMDNPAAQEQMRMGMKMQFTPLYGDLFNEWSLDAAARDAVEALLIDRMMGEMRLGMLMMDEAVPEEDILRRQDEGLAKSRSDLARHLTPAQVARLEAFEREIPQRMAAKQVDQSLEPLGLQPAIRDQVRSAVLEEQKPVQEAFSSLGQNQQFGSKTAEEIRRTREMLTGDMKAQMEKGMGSMRQANERIRARIQPFLTTEQMATYQKQQDAQIQMMEMGMKMMESMPGQ